MENFSRVLNTIDQYKLIHFQTASIRDYIKDFEMVKTWLIDSDKETDNNLVIFKQIEEILTLCVYGIEKKTHKLISELRENVVLSAVGCELGIDFDNEKDFPVGKLVNLFSYFKYNCIF